MYVNILTLEQRFFDSLEIQNSEEEFLLEFLRQGIKSSRRTNSLLFLQDNTDKLLIESFVPIYAMRVATFPYSDIHFDKCGIVETRKFIYYNNPLKIVYVQSVENFYSCYQSTYSFYGFFLLISYNISKLRYSF